MTRTSAIFGIVSVLTAAIVGGVFIRKKIIDDALYWKAWAAFEAEKKRKIRSVEEEINVLNSSLKQNKNKEDILNSQIKKQNKDLEIFNESIEKYEDEIKILKQKNPKNIKVKKVTNISDKRKNLKKKLSDTKFLKMFSKWNSIIKFNDKTLSNYVVERRTVHQKIKEYKSKKNNSIELKIKCENALNNNKKAIDETKNLISKLMENLNKKRIYLYSLKEKYFY